MLFVVNKVQIGGTGGIAGRSAMLFYGAIVYTIGALGGLAQAGLALSFLLLLSGIVFGVI